MLLFIERPAESDFSLSTAESALAQKWCRVGQVGMDPRGEIDAQT